jgi:hypothetical protein
LPIRVAVFLICAFATLALATACEMSTNVAFVNPTNQPLFVQLNERPAFEVPANGAASAPIPALDRLQPMTIIARDAHGSTIFSVTTSLPRIQAEGNKIELKATGEKIDPYARPYPGLPNLD